MQGWRKWCAALLLGACLVDAGAARATGPAASVALEAWPVLGSKAPSGDGWSEVALRVQNLGDAPFEGGVRVTSQLPWDTDATRFNSEAPIVVPGKSAITVRLPTHGNDRGVATVSASVRTQADEDVPGATVTLPEATVDSPLLFDLGASSGVAASLSGSAVAVASPPSRYGYGAPPLSVSAPRTSAATGDLVLPDRASGYAMASVVLADSREIALLRGSAQSALVDWVLGGGALAVVITRPEDLRDPTISALAGGELTQVTASAALRKARTFTTATVNGTSYSVASRAPAPSSAAVLVGHAGGNLLGSPWGEVASYGLGEVHFLAFDPRREPFAGDEWVRLSLVDLVRHTWDRHATIAYANPRSEMTSRDAETVRRVLDPNVQARWAIAVAAMLLMVYAVLAGPVNFYRATRAGKPLRALWQLPLWAAGFLTLIVLLGAVAKGVRGQARHLTLLEMGGGASRAAATRFRAFFTASSDSLLLRPTEQGAVLDVVGANDGAGERSMVVDRDGARIQGLRARPWETVLVRENSTARTGGGISLVEAGSSVTVKNRLGRDLIGVVLVHEGRAVHFARIADGTAVAFSDGKALTAWTPTKTDISAYGFRSTVDADAAGLGAAWDALSSAAGTRSWWPSDVPTLIGQIDGGEGRTSDAGLTVQEDRVLVRVVGWGGTL